MLRLQAASRPNIHRPPRIGLAVAGGGPLGAIYEIGALRAIDESITGLNLHELDVYVGVSAGSFIAACLANHISTAQMCRIFMGRSEAELSFNPEHFLRPAYREYGKRLFTLPRIIAGTLWDLLRHPRRHGMTESLYSFSRAIPTGVFDNETIHRFILKVLEKPGRTNDFRQLDSRLFIVAVDLDSGQAVRFGANEFPEVPISRAVQASAALPGLYPPVRIGGRDYVDGALRRTLHASVALREGLDLLIGINPLVPFQASKNNVQAHHLVSEGLPLVLSQTFRALIQSRMQVGLGKYASDFPHSAILLAEPNRDDELMFFTNIFSYSSRTHLCAHAYQTTRTELAARADDLNSFLAPYGCKLDRELLALPRTLNDSLAHEPRGQAAVSRQLERTLHRLQQKLQQRTALPGQR